MLAAVAALSVHGYYSQFAEIDGVRHRKKAETLDLSATQIAIIAFAEDFPNLRELDLGKTALTPDELLALSALLPDCRISFETSVCGVLTDSTAQLLDLTDSDAVAADELRGTLPLFPALTRVILPPYALTPPELDGLSREFPDILFDVEFTVAETAFTRSATSLTITGVGFNLEELMQALPYLPGIAQIDLTQQPFSAEQALTVAAEFPEIALIWSCALGGRPTKTDSAAINLDGAEITDPSELADALRFFPHLKTVYIDGTNLTDAQIGATADKYPEIRFIWTIRFDIYSLRTDSVAFSTAVNQDVYLPNLTSDEVFALRYCRDLEALDLGHNKISDLGFLSELKNLKILILADNKITDISALKGLPELQYVELFMNRVADISPLAENQNLLDLNLCYNRISEPLPLAGCTRLERLWISHNGIPAAQRRELQSALPNCQIDFSVQESTGNGWRKHPRYFAMRDAFALKYMS